MNTFTKKGFTLLEILLVVAAIGILAGIVILALNPAKQLGDTRNAQRKSDVAALLNSIYQYSIDNNGNFPAGITAGSNIYVFGTAVSGCDTVCTATTTTQAACVDLTTTLTPTYLTGIPRDPTTGTAAITDYYVRRYASGRIIVGACDPEAGVTINVTR